MHRHFSLICTGIILFVQVAFVYGQLLDFCSITAVSSYINKKGNVDIQREKMQMPDVSRNLGGLTDIAYYFGVASQDDLENFENSIVECCKQSDICHERGGMCLPSWSKWFFPCYNDSLCMGHDDAGNLGRCTCILPRSACPCNGTCSYGGKCKNSCSATESLYPDNSCGDDTSQCGCCVQCMGTCAKNGQCKKFCNFMWEIQVGSCMGASDCKCCARCEGSCGLDGICRKICRDTEYQDGWCLENTGCKCCKKEANECSHAPCGRYGICTSSCPTSSTIIGRCSKNCVCCTIYS